MNSRGDEYLMIRHRLIFDVSCSVIHRRLSSQRGRKRHDDFGKELTFDAMYFSDEFASRRENVTHTDSRSVLYRWTDASYSIYMKWLSNDRDIFRNWLCRSRQAFFHFWSIDERNNESSDDKWKRSLRYKLRKFTIYRLFDLLNLIINFNIEKMYTVQCNCQLHGS